MKCSSGFDDTTKLNRHVIECEGVSKGFPCPNCDLFWATGQVLNIHLKKDHKVGEMYTCDTCGKCFKRKISVDSHIKGAGHFNPLHISISLKIIF